MRSRPIASLTNFTIVRPRVETPQEDFLEWLALAYARADAAAAGRRAAVPDAVARMRRRLARFGCGPSRIRSRGTEALDPRAPARDDEQIYRITPELPPFEADRDPNRRGGPNGAGIAARTAFYARTALGVLERLYPPGVGGPSQLVHVTCTGYRSPSAAQRIVDLRGWHGRTAVTHAYHMGCYAALPAIRLAEGLVAVEPGRVDIVHTEICSLHLNPLEHSAEQLVVHSLFADGHIKYSIVPAGEHAGAGFDLLAAHEHILPGTHDSMSWASSGWGMQMTLSRKVPDEIATSLGTFVDGLAGKAGVGAAQLVAGAREAIFAVHPGGPKIIDAVQRTLGLSDAQVRHSKEVLLDYGNMSSATLPHIWSAVLDDEAVRGGQLVVSLAFGPGLTLFGAILRKRSFGPARCRHGRS